MWSVMYLGFCFLCEAILFYLTINKPADPNFFENEIKTKRDHDMVFLLIRRPWEIGASEKKPSPLNCATICHLCSRRRGLHSRRVENASFIECFMVLFPFGVTHSVCTRLFSSFPYTSSCYDVFSLVKGDHCHD